MGTMRVFVTRALLVLLLATLGLVAWLTRHPEAAMLARATGWPVVGGWATAFREAYLPEAATETEPEVEIVVIDRGGGREDLSAPGEVDRLWGARPTVWVGEGTPVLSGPSTGADELSRTGGIANLRVFGRRDDWFQVRYRGELGWVHLEGYQESDAPPLGSEPLPPGPLPAQPADPARLAFVRERLGGAHGPGRLGSYVLLTDGAEPDLISFLDRLLEPLEAIYGDRYGVVPVGEPGGAIVLFSRHEDFAAYQEREVTLHGVRVAGVAGSGVVAIDLEGRVREEIAATLVHEITHLLNRRALGPALPAWLEEGLADDLAHSEVDPEGKLETAHLGGVSLERWDGWEYRGALASAIALRRAVDDGRLRPLDDLLALDWREFVATDADRLNYAQASFWVRQLLADPVLAEGFRDFLTNVAAGGSVTSEELRERLDREWATLDEEFAGWIRIRFHEPSG